MTDAKEWVTIKIPGEVRDRASNIEDTTYEEIMKAGIVAIEDPAPVGPDELVGTPELHKVLNRLDDLQAQLPKNVATELER